MRELTGKMVHFNIQGMDEPLIGMLVSEAKDMVYIRVERETITNKGGAETYHKEGPVIYRQPKGKIINWFPLEDEPKDFQPFHVLFCENRGINCDGVQYVKQGEGFSQADINDFMEPCPLRCDDCRYGTKGELRGVDSEFLNRMIGGTMFGDYPRGEKIGRDQET